MISTLAKWWAFILMLVFATLAISGYISKGETHIVKADERLEGILVECYWTSHLRTLHGGNSTNAMKRVFMVSSGVEFNCGFSWEATIMHYGTPSVRLSHDTHRIDFKSEADSGTRIYWGTMSAANKENHNFISTTDCERFSYLISFLSNISSNKAINCDRKKRIALS